jgi:hypothetical protein
MRTIRTGSGEGTTVVAVNVDAAVEVGVDDGDGAMVGDAGGAAVADAEEAATLADADARSRVTAKASTRGLPFSGTGCSAVSTTRPSSAVPMRATPHARKRPRVIK